MKPIDFPEQTAVYAKGQPRYIPLPAHQGADGRATFCWRLSWRERLQVMFRGILWHQVLTFDKPLQPQKLMTEKPWLQIPEVPLGGPPGPPSTGKPPPRMVG